MTLFWKIITSVINLLIYYRQVNWMKVVENTLIKKPNWYFTFDRVLWFLSTYYCYCKYSAARITIVPTSSSSGFWAIFSICLFLRVGSRQKLFMEYLWFHVFTPIDSSLIIFWHLGTCLTPGNLFVWENVQSKRLCNVLSSSPDSSLIPSSFSSTTGPLISSSFFLSCPNSS